MQTERSDALTMEWSRFKARVFPWCLAVSNIFIRIFGKAKNALFLNLRPGLEEPDKNKLRSRQWR